MNCKQGDIARVIANEYTIREGLADRFVTCTAPTVIPGNDLPAWFIDRAILCRCGCGSRSVALADCILRPIRDPGDDAKDELLRPLPADAGIQHLRETVRAFRSMREHGVCP